VRAPASARRRDDAREREVAQVIASVIEKPRADVYTRDGAKQTIASYFAAEDMGEAERAFGHPPRR
jgi:hypothetical protein